MFSAGTTATQALTAGVADLNAGDWLGLHRHTPAEIYYIVQGHGTVTLDGADYPASAGTAVYIPGGTEHGSPLHSRRTPSQPGRRMFGSRARRRW